MFEMRKKWSEKIRRVRVAVLDSMTPIIEKSGSDEAKFLLPVLRELTLGTVEVRKRK